MQTAVPEPDEFKRILEAEVARLSADHRRFLEDILIPPYQVTLNWEYGKDEACRAWVFADFKEHNVVCEYCLGGFGALGSPWGINFRDADYFGQDSGWYPTIQELLEDWRVEI